MELKRLEQSFRPSTELWLRSVGIIRQQFRASPHQTQAIEHPKEELLQSQ